MENLPNLTDCIFTHYSCDNFKYGERVFVTGSRTKSNTEIWPANNEEEEVRAIESLYSSLAGNPEKVLVHWNMNNYQYGPAHFSRRYKNLTGYDLPILPNAWFDLSNYLWEKYGDNYSFIADKGNHPRLQNLCELNNIKRYGFHSDQDNYLNGSIQQKIHKLNTDLTAIDYILCREIKGILKVNECINESDTANKDIKRLDKQERSGALLALFIVPEGRQVLYNTISLYVDEHQRPALYALIFNGEAPSELIKFHCNQNSLAYIFRQLSDSEFKYNLISGTQKGIAQWICANFAPANFDTIHDVVRGRKEPTKSSRIKINI